MLLTPPTSGGIVYKMKDKIQHRVLTIKGHLLALEKMILQDKYCVDIVHQSMAIQKALKRLDMQIIEQHLKTCAITQIKGGQEKKTIEELLKLYEMKKI